MRNNSSTIETSPYTFNQWPVWLAIGLLWLLIQLPYRLQLIIGKGIGLLALRFARRERHIAEVNLEKCFPHLSITQRQQLLRQSFISMGIGTMETAFGWWASEKRLKKLVTFEGLENIAASLQQQRGVLIFTAHFSSLHLGGRLVSMLGPFAAMYFPPKNPVFKKISLHSMNRYYAKAIPRHDARNVIKALKENLPVLYTPDTDAGPKNSIFAPFFGVNTATVTATARFAKISGCKVLQSSYFRRPDNKGYVIRFHPPLENYPTDDPYADAARINHLIELAVLEHPEQYLWQYKRFKTRPPGEEKFYKKK